MSQARERILSRVSSALKGGAHSNSNTPEHTGADDASRRAAVDARIGAHKPNIIPDRTDGDDDFKVALFRKMLEACDTTVIEVDNRDDVPSLVATYLRDNNQPSRLKAGDDERLAAIDWSRVPTLEIVAGRAEGTDHVGLSHAEVGVAETGTLMLLSGADNPTTLNFLPETHVVLVERKDVVGPYEDGWNRIRSIYGQGIMPRTVNLVSGPSRTADIEQTLINGAHGPKRLLILIV